jgi:hypothetical protein
MSNNAWVWSDHIGSYDEESVQILIWATKEEHPDKDIDFSIQLEGKGELHNAGKYVYAELILPRSMAEKGIMMIRINRITDAQQQYKTFRYLIDQMVPHA